MNACLFLWLINSMLANFQFKAGVGGHFFLRLLIYRWGLGPMPRANSYWNEFHFPYELWCLEKFYRLQIDLPYGEEWFDWETGNGFKYDPSVLEKYLETFRIRDNERMFMLDHAVWPNLNESMKKVKGIECPNVSITTKIFDTAVHCRYLRDIKGQCKDFYNLRSPENNHLREQETWVESGPNLKEMGINVIEYSLKENEALQKSIELEYAHADIILDYDDLMNCDISSFEQLDDYYKLKPAVEDINVTNLIKIYNKENRRLIDELFRNDT